MRYFISAVVVIAGLSQSAAAQSPDLSSVLRGWQKTMNGLKNFACVIERKSLDKALDARDDFSGYALFVTAPQKGNGNLARLELAKTTNKNVFERYIFTGSELHEYVPATKVVRVYKVPNAKKMGLPQENLIGFLFGMGAAQVQQRYSVELEKLDPPNPHYHSIVIRPKTPRDKADFMVARMVLYRDTNMPAQIWYSQPNRNEVTWNFTKMQLNVKEIPARHFVPEVPPGWRVVPVALPPMLPARKQ